jgi:predicted CoA-binding protein
MFSDDELVRDILRRARTIAVVGLSDKPGRDSYLVAAYLQRQGYRIIPVNPVVQEVLGERAYARLEDVPDAIDVVDVFRRPEFVPEIAASAAAVKAGVLWLQEGVVHAEAADKARAAGLYVVMDRCILKEHARLARGPQASQGGQSG